MDIVAPERENDAAAPEGAPAEGAVSDEDLAAAKAEAEKAEAEMKVRLDALGLSLTAKRTEAINARRMSGIEEQWEEDQEFYEGVDEANRDEMHKRRDTRPALAIQVKDAEKTTASTIFPNITAPYSDAAAARVADMLLPTDDRSFKFKPTPVPMLADLAKGKASPQMLREAAAKYPGQPEQAKTAIAQAVEQAAQVIADAKAKAEKAETRVADWHVECQWHAEVRKIIEDATRIGAGVLKGPEPVMKRAVAFINGQLTVQQKINPASKRISAWDLFPDGACGENIHNGAYVFERDRLTGKGLQGLKGSPGYIDSQIDACIEEGPISAVRLAHDPNAKPEQDKKQFEVWYYYGTLDRHDLAAAGCECDEKMQEIPAIITMVNNRVIRAALNPLDTGDFPYDVIPWRKRSGMPWGDGVARQIRASQMIVTAALRAMMTNAGRAAGPIIIWKQGVVVPADNQYTLSPWKIFYMGEDADIDDVNKALAVIQIPMYQAELERIIQIGLKLAEDVTGLPMIMQGQMGKAPDTVGGMQILNENASAVLRRIARAFDDCITEPHVRRYYTWLLQYGEDDEKGDFQIDARGSSALVEKSLQAQEIATLLKAAGNPIYGIDPKKTMTEHLKARKLDPKNFQFDDEEWKKIVENLGKGPQDPRFAVAQLRAQVDKYGFDMEGKLQLLEQHWQEQENARDRQLEMIIKEMEQTGAKDISLDSLKGRLADTTIKTRTQKELSLADSTRQALAPPTEPTGRAPTGKAFAR